MEDAELRRRFEELEKKMDRRLLAMGERFRMWIACPGCAAGAPHLNCANFERQERQKRFDIFGEGL